MTPAQKAAIKKAQAEQTQIYRQQREDPHYIITVGKGKIATFKKSEEQVAPCSTYISTEEILKEVDEVIKNKGKRAAPVAPPITPATTGGKGKRTLVDLPRQGGAKYPRTESTDDSGKGENPPTNQSERRRSRAPCSTIAIIKESPRARGSMARTKANGLTTWDHAPT
jgi:hypothetical protein